jgi:hypothetical protein
MTIGKWYRAQSDCWTRFFFASFIPVLIASLIPDKYGRDHLWVFAIYFASLMAMFGGLGILIYKVARIPCPVCGGPLGIPVKISLRRFAGPCPHCGASFSDEMPSDLPFAGTAP